MSVKNFLKKSAFAVAGVSLATAALAGGPDMHHPNVSGFYLGANAGYARVDWENSAMWQDSGVTPVGATNGEGGFAFGFDLGYRWNHSWATELGWYQFSPATMHVANSALNTRYRSYAAYLTQNFIVPVGMMHNLSFVMKAGLGYRHVKISGNTETVFGANFVNDIQLYKWTPVFGIGFNYAFSNNWSFDGQYLWFPGGSFNGLGTDNVKQTSNYNANVVPAANLFTVGVNYMFAM